MRELTYTVDRYNGATIDLLSVEENPVPFALQLEELEQNLTDIKLLWITVPIQLAPLIPILTQRDFRFHQCSDTELRLVKKIVPNPVLPTAKNFTVGVGAVVIHNEQLLVIKNKYYGGYMLPGGHIDNNEMIRDALVREVLEETGVEVAFESIVNLGHFTKGQFGDANMYIVCKATALTTDIAVQDVSEIVEARWIPITEYLNLEDTNPYNRAVVNAAQENEGFTFHELSLKVPCPFEVFF